MGQPAMAGARRHVYMPGFGEAWTGMHFQHYVVAKRMVCLGTGISAWHGQARQTGKAREREREWKQRMDGAWRVGSSGRGAEHASARRV